LYESNLIVIKNHFLDLILCCSCFCSTSIFPESWIFFCHQELLILSLLLAGQFSGSCFSRPWFALKLPLALCFWFAAQICASVFTSTPDLILHVEFVSGTIWFPVSGSFFRLTLVLISIRFSRAALISGNGPAVRFLACDFALRFAKAR
jgi:hypothetical protein